MTQVLGAVGDHLIALFQGGRGGFPSQMCLFGQMAMKALDEFFAQIVGAGGYECAPVPPAEWSKCWCSHPCDALCFPALRPRYC